jgi:hypothetical protein
MLIGKLLAMPPCTAEVRPRFKLPAYYSQLAFAAFTYLETNVNAGGAAMYTTEVTPKFESTARS